jgi:hypothetical protein
MDCENARWRKPRAWESAMLSRRAATSLCRLGCAATALLVACAAPPSAPSAAPAAQDCSRWLEAVSRAVDDAGVRDVQDDRIAGHPTLRVDRLGAALAPRAAQSEAAWRAWLERLRTLDLEGRRIELANLPTQALPDDDDRSREPRLSRCSRELTDALPDDAAARAALRARAHVEDRYSGLARTAGLYALTRVPFFAGVQRWQAEHEAAMREAAARPQPAMRWAPEIGPALAAPPPAPLAHDALGLPLLDAAAAEHLLAAHAPLFDVQTQGGFDAIGAPAWRADGSLAVDSARPVVYQRIAHTLVQGRPLLQLVYTLWFPERPKRGALDLFGGALDGVIVRLTLAPDGRVLMLDSIHACGCYHLFFPARGVTPRPGAPTDEEWAFAPAGLPDLAPGDRLVVRIESATHYVLGVSAAPASSVGDARYARRPEPELRRLPLPGGDRRSLYGPDGLVAGSERAERFFFWPMGIASAGATRQWGHHATAFVGRRHFDDADLLDRRFEFPPLQDKGPATPALP